MSFASGFNSGLNLTAQLRADSRARRQEERQAQLDERAERRAKVQDSIDNLKVEELTRKLELEREVAKQTALDKTTSKVALGKFNAEAKKIPIDDVDAYTNLYAEYRPMMSDPEVLESFQSIHTVRAANYADRKGNIGVMQKEAREKELSTLSIEMDSLYGIDADPTTPQGISRIMGYKRWKKVDEALSKSDMSWESIDVKGDSFNLSEEQLGQAMKKFQGVAEERGMMDSLPAEQRGLLIARKEIDPTAPVETQMEQSRLKGAKMSDSLRTEIDDSFIAMGLLINADRALEDLGIPTGKGVGWFASNLIKLAQQDSSVADFEASITQLVPKLARGVFGEVGVLTDADIENYQKTVASLAQTPDANKRVMEHTKALIARSNRKKLERLAQEGLNVSQYLRSYKVFKGTPFMVYRSMDSARKNLYGDVFRETIKPGDKYLVWNEETRSFDADVAKTLQEYNPNYKPDSTE